MAKTARKGLNESHSKYCEACGERIHSNAKACPHCGFTSRDKTTSKVLAIIGLIVNLFFLPGLGTIIGGNAGTGVIQLVLILISIPLMFILIGIPLAIGVWIWALISSIGQISCSE